LAIQRPSGGEFLAPDIGCTVQSAPGGELPFRLAGQLLACPTGKSNCVVPSNVHDWMIFSSS
jgi:hypothetical protein